MTGDKSPNDETETNPSVRVEFPHGSEDPETRQRLFELLADRRRRQILIFLSHLDDHVTTLDQLVDGVRAMQPPSDESPPLDRKELMIMIHHIHLPWLAEAGVVEYDAASRTIRYHPDARLEAYIEPLAGDE